MQKPAFGRFHVPLANRAQRGPGNKTNRSPERFQFLRIQLITLATRRNSRLPENLVRHPVTNPGKTFLVEQDRLDWSAAVSPNEQSHERETKLRRMQLGADRAPPSRFLRPLLETDPSKLAGIAKDQRLALLTQDEVIVLSRDKAGRLDPKIPAHPKMNPEPVAILSAGPHDFAIVFCKDEEQLFPFGGGTEQFSADKFVGDALRIGAPENPLLGVKLHRQDSLAEPRVPPFAGEFHLCQFRHRGD